MEMESTGFLTKEADPSGTTLVDDRNGFNKLSRLTMLWTVWHCWPAGVRFAFILYKHWAQLLLLHCGEPPVTLLIQKGVTQRDPSKLSSMVLPLSCW